MAERTVELTRANESLNHEIAERRRSEESRRKLEEQLQQARKMEAIGTLAGGIAHDFNNILAVIIPYTHLAFEELEGHPESQEYLIQILTAADRAKNLVQQILAFSRRQRQERQVIDLQPVVTEALKLLRSALPSTIEIVQRLNPTPPVLADSTQIHQVVMNLCNNAEHAMRGRSGRLEITLEPKTVDEAFVNQYPSCDRAGTPAFVSEIMVAACRPNCWTASSSRFSPPRNRVRARDWACPSFTESSRATTASSSFKASPAKERNFKSFFRFRKKSRRSRLQNQSPRRQAPASRSFWWMTSRPFAMCSTRCCREPVTL